LSTLSTLLQQLLDPKEPTEDTGDATTEQITAGRGLAPRDMTPEERHEHKLALQRRRARKYRKRQERADENAAKERAPVPQTQVKDALDITVHLSAKIDLVTQRRVRKAARLLGTVAEDCTFETFAAVNRSIAGAIYRDEREREELLAAAEWLSRQPGIPNVRHGEAPPHAGWLMSVIEFRSRSALHAWYDQHPSIESLAAGDSVLGSSHTDDYFDRFCADGQPQILGARWPRPGQIDLGLVQAVIAGAITARGLDPLVELILANYIEGDLIDLRSEERFDWAEHAGEVFQALDLQMHWHLLCRKVESREVRGRYAREAARHALSFILPAMHQAIDLLEQGEWVAPDPVRIHQTLLIDPRDEARAIAHKLEAALL